MARTINGHGSNASRVYAGYLRFWPADTPDGGEGVAYLMAMVGTVIGFPITVLTNPIDSWWPLPFPWPFTLTIVINWILIGWFVDYFIALGRNNRSKRDEDPARHA